MHELKQHILELGRRAREAARVLGRMNAEQKNHALENMAHALLQRRESILAANASDVAHARDAQLSPASIDRLRLDFERLEAMATAIRHLVGLPDPVGEILREWTRPNGLRISKVRVPIGVIGIIYESRPNVTSDAAVLCMKTGNAVILRGGSESMHSNTAIAEALRAGAAGAGLPADSILLVPRTERVAVQHMCEMDEYVDLIIPRGGQSLIDTVVQHARMPVIKHYQGICIVYVDKAADLEMAEHIVLNAKCQRPGVCNAMETLLVHRDVAERFLYRTGGALVARGVEIRGDERVRELLANEARTAQEEDWRTEYLDLIVAAKVVESEAEAIAHINHYGSHHSDCIVTDDAARAERFLSEVDSATVYWNASTRFTDGGEFGFGAEIGISTDKLHARGPMALEELTTYKYIIRGDGQVRE